MWIPDITTRQLPLSSATLQDYLSLHSKVGTQESFVELNKTHQFFQEKRLAWLVPWSLSYLDWQNWAKKVEPGLKYSRESINKYTISIMYYYKAMDFWTMLDLWQP